MPLLFVDERVDAVVDTDEDDRLSQLQYGVGRAWRKFVLMQDWGPEGPRHESWDLFWDK